MRRLIFLGGLLAVGCTFALAIATSSATGGNRTFYLAVHPRQCLLIPKYGGGKSVLVVSCADPTHNEEVYAIEHGGWGHYAPPGYSTAYAIARSSCLGAFKRLTGRRLAANQGWSASWPDPGPETARYGDKIICKFRTWPQLRPLGRGWHVH
jgi:hypothetical protein